MHSLLRHAHPFPTLAHSPESSPQASTNEVDAWEGRESAPPEAVLVKCLEYGSWQDVGESDHKPVRWGGLAGGTGLSDLASPLPRVFPQSGGSRHCHEPSLNHRCMPCWA